MHTQSFPALLPLRAGIAAFLIAGAAAAAQTPDQLSEGTNESVVMVAPAPPIAGTGSIPSGAPSTFALAKSERVQSALSNYEHVLEEHRANGNREGEAEDLAAIASAYRVLGQEQKAVDNFQSAIAIFHGVGNRKYEATAVAHLGDVYREWGFADTALRFYRKAVRVYSAISDQNGEAAALNNSGAAWFKLGNRGKCLESFRQAMARYERNHDDRGDALASSNLGAAYLYFSDDPEKALHVLEEAVAKMELLGDNADEANALEMMGFAWLKGNGETKAAVDFQHARALFHALGDTIGEARVAGHMMLIAQLEQGNHSRKDRWAGVSLVSPAPLVLTAARLRVFEVTR